MSGVQDFVKCPQCGYEKADYLFDCRTNGDDMSCRRCGYCESWKAKSDDAGEAYGWKHDISIGAGALWYRRAGQGIFCGTCFTTPNEVLEAEQRLREAVDKGKVDPDVSYLTKWNPQTEQVEFIIGKFYEMPETELVESEGEAAAPVPSSQQTQSDSDSEDVLPL